jgi:hypothetical protein
MCRSSISNRIDLPGRRRGAGMQVREPSALRERHVRGATLAWLATHRLS